MGAVDAAGKMFAAGMDGVAGVYRRRIRGMASSAASWRASHGGVAATKPSSQTPESTPMGARMARPSPVREARRAMRMSPPMLRSENRAWRAMRWAPRADMRESMRPSPA